MGNQAGHPTLIGVPPGENFPQALKQGLIQRFSLADPLKLARVEVFLNTRRMSQAVRSEFTQGGPRLLPRIRLVSDIGANAQIAGLPPPPSMIKRRLEVAQLVGSLLAAEPSLAPRSSVFALADDLIALLDEAHSEGVSFSEIASLDVSSHADYWAKSQKFLSIIDAYTAQDTSWLAQAEARQREAVTRLCAAWEAAPPDHPVVIAGSTGSRATTRMLMEAIARLPKGLVVLPGFDIDFPPRLEHLISDPNQAQDHPQARFAQFLKSLGIGWSEVEIWSNGGHDADRNRVVSLALRPAPVTNQWLTEGPDLPDLKGAMNGVSLIEAPSQQAEAAGIAVALREAAEQGVRAALVSPDRTLTRRVAAALGKWGIDPDDSAGEPLPLSPPGRLLSQAAQLLADRITTPALLALLKHPLTHTGSDERGQHLLWVRELEIWLRKHSVPFPDPNALAPWVQAGRGTARESWDSWLISILELSIIPSALPIRAWVDTHVSLTERISTGSVSAETGELWREAAGRKALEVISDLQLAASDTAELTPAEYDLLVSAVLNDAVVRTPDKAFSNIMIWGTLEARVQGAELVILGGLNEGTWPEQPAPDPWLNTAMRKQLGLLLPDRRIGLSAHDFQQAIGARQVILSRSTRDAEAQTVASRWVNRLLNLLNGLPRKGGELAIAEMRARGNRYLEIAASLAAPNSSIPAEPRPAPCPPIDVRPRRLSVTRVDKLIRDPYSVYASHILGVFRLNPLQPQADARVRGIALHAVMEAFSRSRIAVDQTDLKARFDALSREVLAKHVPWPSTRAVWLGRLLEVADDFLKWEVDARKRGTSFEPEIVGQLQLGAPDFTLTAKADRIDLLHDGKLAIYDYKTGSLKSKKQITHFDKQLLLEALIAEAGGFEGVDATAVSEVAYIGIGTAFSIVSIEPGSGDTQHAPAQVRADLIKLLLRFLRADQGYQSRRAVADLSFAGDYDHLARYGEWDDASDPVAQVLT